MILFLLRLPFLLGPLASFPLELISNYGSYVQLLGHSLTGGQPCRKAAICT
jgi:hypothetical protein